MVYYGTSVRSLDPSNRPRSSPIHDFLREAPQYGTVSSNSHSASLDRDRDVNGAALKLHEPWCHLHSSENEAVLRQPRAESTRVPVILPSTTCLSTRRRGYGGWTQISWCSYKARPVQNTRQGRLATDHLSRFPRHRFAVS